MSEPEIAKAQKLFNQVAVTGVRDLALVFDVVVYLSEPLSGQWDGIVRFYNLALERIRSNVRYYVVDGRRKFKRVDKRTFDLLPFWATRDAAPRDIYGLTLQGGDHPDEATENGFDFYSDGAYLPYVRLVLPASVALEAGLAEHIVELVRPLKLESGTAGYAVSSRYDYYTSSADNPVFALSRRFRCVDFGMPEVFAKFVREGLKTVNWMTFIGDSLLQREGGAAVLERAKPSDITIHRLDHGLAFQAGPLPILGDANRREDVSRYRRINSLLRRSRFPVDTIGRQDGIGGEENTREWLARFDDEAAG